MNHSALRSLLPLLALAGAVWADPVYKFTEVSYPGSDSTMILGINNAGVVVGRSWDQGWAHEQDFTFDGTTYTPLSFCPLDIDSAGMIVGGLADADFATNGIAYGVTYSAGTMTLYSDSGRQLGLGFTGINDAGILVGHYGFGLDDVSTGKSFFYNNSTGIATDFPSDATVTNPDAWGINDAGVVVGKYGPGSYDTLTYGFVYFNGVYTTVAYPGAATTNLEDINNGGWAIGYWGTGAGNVSGSFLYKDGIFLPLPEFTQPAPWGASPGSYRALNDFGVVAGDHSWFDAEGNWHLVGFIGEPTPEPAAWALFGAGLLTAASLRRRLRR